METRWMFVVLAAVGLLAAGCSDGAISIVGDDDTYGEDDDDVADDDDDDVSDDDTADDDDSMWDDAELVVLSPESGAYIPLSEDVVLSAEILDVDGEVMDHDEIIWTTDQDEDFEFVGAFGEIADFPVGSHTITAKTELPNGDRLTYAVGGVLVQHQYAGVYSGTVNLSVDFEIQGYPISASCIGSADFEVDAYGEILEGEGACVASVAGYFDLDVALLIDGEIDGDAVAGDISIDLGWLGSWPTGFEGEFSGEVDMVGSFETDLGGTTITGEIDAHRVALGV